MEIRINRVALVKALSLAQSIADKKSTLPILANVLLRADGKALHIAATDLQITVTGSLDCEVRKAGALTVGAKRLYDLVKAFTDEEVTIAEAPNHYAEVKCGKSKFNLVGLAARDFPEVHDHSKVKFSPIDAAALLDCIERTEFAICKDIARTTISGALFESDGKHIGMVATDGHRLSHAAHESKGPKLASGIVIPPKGMAEIRGAITGGGDIGLGVVGERLFLKTDSAVVSMALIPAQFPPWDQMWPSEFKTATCPREALLDAVNRCLLVAGTGPLAFEASAGKLRLTCASPDNGEAVEEVDAGYDGPTIKVGLASAYAAQALGAISGDEVCVDISGEDRYPMVFRAVGGDKKVGVLVMSMRL